MSKSSRERVEKFPLYCGNFFTISFLIGFDRKSRSFSTIRSHRCAAQSPLYFTHQLPKVYILSEASIFNTFTGDWIFIATPPVSIQIHIFMSASQEMEPSRILQIFYILRSTYYRNIQCRKYPQFTWYLRYFWESRIKRKNCFKCPVYVKFLTFVERFRLLFEIS